MPTIIDALIVTLGLDPKPFKKGAKEAEDAQGKLDKRVQKGQTDTEKAAKKASDQMGKFRNELLRTAAAIMGLSAIKSFVASVTQSDAALGRMATNLDTQVGALSNWENAARLTGGSAAGMDADMKGLVQTVQRFSLTGEGGESLKYFRALGVNVADSRGKMRDIGAVMLELADKFQGMDPAKAQALGAGMGLSEQTINLLHEGRAAVQAYLDAAAKANTRTGEDVKNAQERQKAWLLLTETFNRLATDILNVVSPALVGLMNFIREHAGAATALIGGLTLALTAMSVVKFAGVVSGLAKLVGGTAAAASETTGLISLLGKGGLVAAAGLAAFGIARLVSEVTGFDSIMDSVGSKIYDWTHKDVSMAGGYMPGTRKGLGNRGGGGAGAGAGGGDKGAYLTALEKQFGLPAGLLDAVWAQESGRGRNKLSRAGAKGDFQFMDKTAAQYGVLDSNDFGQSAMGAARMYSDLLKQYKGNLPMALAGYNWGSGNLAAGGMGNLPAETQGYIRNIMGSMRGGSQGAGSTNSAETHIGQIVVNTPASDGQGVARDLRQALQRQGLALQANQGLAS